MRTYKEMGSEELLAIGLKAADGQAPDYETLTDVWLEFKRRGRDAKAGAYAAKLAKRGFPPVTWLAAARDVAARFVRKKPGRHHVYVVLLDGFVASGERYGLYVGETRRRPEERFKQHQSGGKLAARCHRKMRALLPSLFEHLNPLDREEARQLEVELVLAFESARMRVHGPRELKPCKPRSLESI